MVLTAAVSISAAAIGLVFALVSWRMARAPGWGEMRCFALIALTAGLYSLFDLPTNLEVRDTVVTWCARLSLCAGALHAPAWLVFAAAQEQRRARTWERMVLLVATMLAILSLLPGVVVTDVVTRRTVAWFGVTYNEARPSTFGAVAFAVYCASLASPLIGFLRATRRGRPDAWHYIAGLTLLCLAATNDIAVATGLLPGLYLLGVGFLGSVAVVGIGMISRFVDQARQLDAFSRQLETEVERRTQELAAAQSALLHAEKLAALGRVAAGVAHEVNNPAAVVLGNLDYLRLHLVQKGTIPADLQPCLDDASVAVRRIARIVRQLAAASRSGSDVKVALGSHSLRGLVETAVANARVGLDCELDLAIKADHAIHALCDPALLEQVVVNLVTNAGHAVQAVSPRGTVEVAVDQVADQVVIDVRDNGPGIAAEIRAHLFEPFVTTKQLGQGTGLGLMVSLGLMRSQGGDLVMAATGPKGTTMRATLSAGMAAEPEAPAPICAAGEPTLRLLLVDDEDQVRRALQRQLASRFLVTTASGVEDALAIVRREPDGFDVVLCDLMMPDGGGERFAREVGELESRTIYFTGGITDAATLPFFAGLGVRGLHKPLDPDALLELARRLRSSAAMLHGQ